MRKSCWMWPCIIMKKYNVSSIGGYGILLESFHAHTAADETTRLYRVSDCVLKTQNNNATVIPPYTLQKCSSINLHHWSTQWRFILVNSLTSAINSVIKDPFVVTCDDILEKRIICLPWKKMSLTTCYFPNSSH